MSRKTKFILLIMLIIMVITYLEVKITSGDLNYHFGKDGGIFRRFESILLLGSTFFVVLSKTKRVLFLFVGFFASLISSLVIYIVLAFSYLFEGELPFHIISCLAFIALFFFIEKLIAKATTTI